METLSKKYLIYSDINYTKAINYSHKYNAPVTLNYGPKHNRVKYILSAGSGDGITLLQEGIYIYVISQNKNLNYIGMQVINTEAKQIEGEVFLEGDDCTNEENFSFGILDKDINIQFKILCEYL